MSTDVDGQLKKKKWGVCVGLGIAFGWGFKDVIAESAKEWIKSLTTTAEKVEEARAKEKTA